MVVTSVVVTSWTGEVVTTFELEALEEVTGAATGVVTVVVEL